MSRFTMVVMKDQAFRPSQVLQRQTWEPSLFDYVSAVSESENCNSNNKKKKMQHICCQTR